jgi:hypothetical protein
MSTESGLALIVLLLVVFRAVASKSPRERRGHALGDYFAEVLLLDQGTIAARARAELG